MKFIYLALIQVFFFQSFSQISDLQKAKQAYDKASYKEAIKLYTKLITDGNATHLDYYYRGYAYYFTKMSQNAYDDFSVTIKLAPDFAEAYFIRGSMLINSEQVQDAINDLNMAVKYATNDTIKVISYSNRASAKLYTQNLEGAMKDCLDALKIDSASRLSFGAYVNLSTCYGQQKKHNEAIDILKKVYKMDSTDTAIITNLGFEYSQIGKQDTAIKYFDKALKIKQNDAFVISNKSYALLKLGKIKEAHQAINRSININANNSYAYRNLGLIYIEMKDTKKACEAFNLALRKGFTEMYGIEVLDLVKINCK